MPRQVNDWWYVAEAAVTKAGESERREEKRGKRKV